MNENVDFIARCIAGSAQETARKAMSNLGGMQILKLTKEEFDNIEHDPNTIYYVIDGDTITQYIGDIYINSGVISNYAMKINNSNKVNSIIGIAEGV